MAGIDAQHTQMISKRRGKMEVAKISKEKG